MCHASHTPRHVTVQATVFKPRKYAGSTQEGNEGHINQHGKAFQPTVISETVKYNEIVNNNNNSGIDSQKNCDKKIKGNAINDLLRISSLNIRRGLYKKEEELILLMQEQNCDVCSFSEVDIEDFNEKKPFSIEGFKTFFPLKRTGSNKKRLICLVKVEIETKQRDDLMSEALSNVWLEINGINQKVLICAMYREFNDLTGKGQMSTTQQLEKLELLHTQIEKASKEGLILIIGDMNIDLQKWEDPKYYQKQQAEKYQSIVGECGLEIIDFGITYNGKKDGEIVISALDHAITNKPMSVREHRKTFIDESLSDHHMISVDLDVKTPKFQGGIVTSRDYRKLRKIQSLF